MPSFPSGWYQVLTSRELGVGEVRALRYFGQNLVLFRTTDGTARVLDAHCAHLGAHLGRGGRVEGDCIRCPFHGWLYASSGECREVPGLVKVPPRATVRPWHAQESDGLIFVYYSATPGAAPGWDVPRIAEYGSPEWTEYQEHRFLIRTHVQEIAENIVDPAHFSFVHRTVGTPETTVELRGPVLIARSATKMRTPRGDVDVRIDAAAYGLGLWLIRFSGIVETVLVTANTPIDEDTVENRLSFMVRKTGGATNTHGVGKALIDDVVKQVKEDIEIWEHKIYQADPVFGAFDRSIVTLRRWCQQFYRSAENGPEPEKG